MVAHDCNLAHLVPALALAALASKNIFLKIKVVKFQLVNTQIHTNTTDFQKICYGFGVTLFITNSTPWLTIALPSQVPKNGSKSLSSSGNFKTPGLLARDICLSFSSLSTRMNTKIEGMIDNSIDWTVWHLRVALSFASFFLRSSCDINAAYGKAWTSRPLLDVGASSWSPISSPTFNRVYTHVMYLTIQVIFKIWDVWNHQPG